MSAKTVLHIQGREEAPPQIVELIDDRAIRIGRGRRCEVRLTGHRLSDVMCTLKQTPEGWLLQPQAGSAMMSIYGEPVGRPRILEINVPLRIDDYWLVLRQVEAQVGTFDAPIVIEPDVEEMIESSSAVRAELVDLMAESVIDVPVIDVRQVSAPPADDLAREAARLREWAEKLAEQERLLKDAEKEKEKSWEARRRAAAERMLRTSRPQAETAEPVEPRRPIPRVPQPTADLLRPAPTNRVDPKPYEREVRPPRLMTSPAARERVATQPRSGYQPAASRLRPMSRSTPPPPPTPPPVEPMPEPTAADSLEFDPSRFSAFISETAPPSNEVHTSATGLLDWDDSLDSEVVSGFEEPTPEPMPSPAPAPEQFHPAHAPHRPHVRPAVGAPLIPERPFGVDPAALKSRLDLEDASARYPTARAILDAQRRREIADPAKPRKFAGGPRPTESRPPDSWNAPFWLAVIPGLILTIGVGGASLGLSTLWALDAEASTAAFAAAIRSETEPARALDPTVRPNRAWYRANPNQLAAWALALERSGEGPESLTEAAELLEAAKHVAPLNPTVRFALAQSPAGTGPAAALGLSRDPSSLPLTARMLRKAGKTADAVRIYRQALELAARSDPDPSVKPSFDEDPQIRRFRMPEESNARPILIELAESTDWPYAEWAAAVPPIASVRLAAARVLRAKGNPDAEAAYDAVLAVNDPPPTGLASHLAARGEALAFRNRVDEAVESYKKGIEAAESDQQSRLFSYNLAEILRTLSRDKERSALLQASVGEDLGEEITRRALEAQALSGLIADPTSAPTTTDAPRDSAVLPVGGAPNEEPNLRRGAN